ncbi:alpha/beta fold hydrolase [Halobacterium jilantaiense]|uniref:Pimeloyl-ACP methyl ester carboxylesterase n=1 Tax=Halobacterium jilantaiense TaxID=355548 RepID=A0A1I0PDN4_9EURY|nr:alpha/beta hydrolase [Halobacterium jilantaiense]SEW12332.1 Pimeloyl-ACP methyl ester carboxylesterase [Halobacterium jilantaiense]
MQTVVSADGTEIAYESRGNGRPIVLVHGIAGSKESWRTIPERLADDFRAVAMDRRGRGDSGDGDRYALQREVEDVQAVLDAVGDDPVLFGHSFGGLVALEAAADADIDSLLLYEPAVVVGEHPGGVQRAARMRDLLAAGDREQAVELFFRGFGGQELVDEMPIAAIAGIAETVVREHDVVVEYGVDEFDADVDAPARLVVGEASDDHVNRAVDAVADRLGADVVTLAETGHHGLETAPAQLEDAVRSFLD